MESIVTKAGIVEMAFEIGIFLDHSKNLLSDTVSVKF